MQVNRLLNVFLVASLVAVPVLASEMRYTPVNPSFGGSPFNTQLLAVASAQNDHEKPISTANAYDNLSSTVTSYVLSRVSGQISDQIFTKNTANPGGRVVLPDGTSIVYQQNFATNTVTATFYSPDGVQITSISNVNLTAASR